MKKFLIVLPVLVLTVYAAATRTLNFETWTTKLSNQDLTITPSGTGVLSVGSDLIMSGSGALKLPEGTEAQRPGSPVGGEIRLNSETTSFEGYNGSAWGSLGGGAGTKDIVVQEDFEGATNSSDFTCDTNLTAADDTSTPLNDRVSLTFTQGATPPAANAKCAGPTFTLPLKAQSKNLVEVCFNATSDANDNEFAVNVEGNTSGQLVQVLVENTTTAKKHCGYFSTDGDTTVDVDIEVLVQNANSVLEIDDVEITIDPLTPTDIYASSEWESCGLTASDFQGVGSPTNIDIDCKRDGTDLLMRGTFTTGTVTATEFRMNLKSGLTSSANIDTLEFAGGTVTNGSAVAGRTAHWLMEPSVSYVTAGYGDNTRSFFTKDNGNALFASSTNTGVFVRVPIAGWSDTAQGVVVKNRSDSASVENDFSAIVDTSTCAVSDQDPSPNWLSCSVNTTNICDCTVSSSTFTVFPHITECGGDIGGEQICDSVSGLSFRILSQNANGTTNIAADMNISVRKKGTDYIKETDKVYTVPVDTLTGNWVRAEGNGGTSITASTTDIPFIEVTDTASAWDGDSYTVQKNNSVLTIKAATLFTTVGTRLLTIYKNGSQYKLMNGNNTSATGHSAIFTSSRGEFALGDVISIRDDNAGGTLSNSSVSHYLNITESYGDRGTFLGNFSMPTCYVKDVKSSGTDGGGCTSGSFQTRDLNTTEGDCSFLSLASNQITLESGAYNIECKAPAFRTDFHKIKIRNTSDSVDEIIGSSEYMSSAATDESITQSFAEGQVVLNSSKTYEVQHRCLTTRTTDGFGRANSFGVDEVYSQCKITKVR